MFQGHKLYNVNRNKNEQAQKVMVALANDYDEVPEVTEGNIAAVTGLKVRNFERFIRVLTNS